jgi:hypothetical protein
VTLGKLSKERRQTIEHELGGPKKAHGFFKKFRFSHSEEANVNGLERRLKGLVVPTDTTSSGWLLLRQQVRRWATHSDQPEPDGKIRHSHLVQIISKTRPKPIPQNFIVPDVYAVPSQGFHDNFVKRITVGQASVVALWGTPGRGKSTYLSFLVRELRNKKFPVIRHHYFLSLDDTTGDRIAFADIALTLMDQMTTRYPEAVKQKGLEESPNTIREWLTACGKYYAARRKKFYVVIDGLDHVWREQMNITQMNHLFNYLLPCPKNVVLVVGTQRVADHQLPSRLLTHAKPSAWIEIPAMDERAVHKWIVGQQKAGRVQLARQSRFKEQRKEALDAVSAAFFKISSGNPLHLIYSFETLVRRGPPLTPDEIMLLPRCPDGDIRRYYRSLWGRLTPVGKQVLHLIAGVDFRWPADGLRGCAGPLEEVDHLVEHRRTGVVPFHGSILAYVREQSDHESSVQAGLPRVVRWLERHAAPFWQWGWLWVTKARLGKDSDLLTKTTRTWVVDSLAAGWPANQMIAILRDAERRAFAKNDYCRSIELRSLKIRLKNGPRFQTHRYPEFLECAIRSGNNNQQIINMADDIGTLDDNELLALSRCVGHDLSAEIGAECESELKRRTNLWIDLRHRPDNEFVRLAQNMIEATARHGQMSVQQTLRFIEAFRDSDLIFQSLLTSLSRTTSLDLLFALITLLNPKRHRVWRTRAQDMAVRVAALEGVDLSLRISRPLSSVSPLMTCWLLIRGTVSPPLPTFSFDPALLERDRYEYGPNAALEAFFHGLFFTSLATYRTANRPFSFPLPALTNEKLGWLKTAVDSIQELAKGIADGTLKAAFSVPFSQMVSVEPVRGRRSTDAASAQYWSFKAALRQIATDLHLIGQTVPDHCKISYDEFQLARASPHWDDAGWLSDNLDGGLALLRTDAAAALVRDLSSKEAKAITAFNEKAEQWIDLSRFGLLYGLPNITTYVRRASSCIVGYGCHKDPYIYDVLDAIAALHISKSKKALPLLMRTAPFAERITEFTDGDDVGHAPMQFIDLVGAMTPSRLPKGYAHYIRSGEWERAERAFTAYYKILDFDDKASRALARTFLDREELLALKSLSDEGRPKAREALAEQVRFLGGIPKSHKFDQSNTEDPLRGGKPPDVRRFKPAKFSALVDELSDPKVGYHHQRDALTQWIRYWTDRGKGIEAIHAVDQFFANEAKP